MSNIVRISRTHPTCPHQVSDHRRALLWVALPGILLLTAGFPAHAQSLFDNGTGEGSISVQSGGRLDFNFTEQLANFTITTSSFARLFPDKGGDILLLPGYLSTENPGGFKRFSLSLRAKPDKSTANLFGTSHPGVGAGVTLGYGISRMAARLPSQADGAFRNEIYAALERKEDRIPPTLSDDWKIRPLNKPGEGEQATTDIESLQELETLKKDELAQQLAKYLQARKALPVESNTPASRELIKQFDQEKAKLSELEKEFLKKSSKIDLTPFSKEPTLTEIEQELGEKENKRQQLQDNVLKSQDKLTQTEAEYQTALQEGNPQKITTTRKAKVDAEISLEKAREEETLFPSALDGLTAQKELLNGNITDASVWLNALVYIPYKQRAQAVTRLKNQQKFYPETNITLLSDAIKFLEKGHTFDAQGPGPKTEKSFTERIAFTRAMTSASSISNIDYDHLDFRLSLDYDRFQLADANDEGKAVNIATKNTTKIDFLAAYSLEWGNKPTYNTIGEKQSPSPYIFGIAGGYGKESNRNDLTVITGSNALPRSNFSEENAWHVNTDLAYSPGGLNNRVWLNLFTRNTVTSGEKGHRYGLGAFLTEENNSYKSIGGVSVAYDSEKQLRVDLTAGFNF